MSEKRFEYDKCTGIKDLSIDENDDQFLYPTQIVDLLNKQQVIIEELKTYNLQHFLEWLVIKGYVADESMKDINNVIDCVNRFKEYLTDEQFKELE